MNIYVLYKAPFQTTGPRTDLAIYKLCLHNELVWEFVANVDSDKVRKTGYNNFNLLKFKPGELQVMYNRSNVYYYTLEFKRSQINGHLHSL